MEAYDENDIEDFEDYLHYYGIPDEDEVIIDDNDDDIEIDSDIRELYF